MKEVDPKYKISLIGKYFAGVNYCPECDFKSNNITNQIIGIADARIGSVFVVECPKCFEKWYFHARLNEYKSMYDYFLEAIQNGTQNHYKQ